MRHEMNQTAEPTLTALLRQLGTDSTTLIRNEIALAKMEAHEVARVAAIEGAKLGAAIALAAVGGLALVAWLIMGLGNVIGQHYATAALIVGLILLTIGAILATRGMRGLRSGALKPVETIDTLQEDKRWVAQQVKEFKAEVSSRP